MPAAVSNTRTGSVGPLGNDYDNAVDDFLQDIPLNNGSTTVPHETSPAKDLDEEIKVRKKRIPVPKLDETRLLSEAGIPKLRKIARTRLKFKGKGHEFSDMSRLLNTYQLWLDDLYPRAKFRDGLAMVEKLGHSKRMQMTRREWIDESKPSRRELTPNEQREEAAVRADAQVAEQQQGDSFSRREPSGPEVQDRENNTRPHEDDQDMPDDDELDMLLNNTTSQSIIKPNTQRPRGPFEDDSDDEDELAALMAEQETTSTTKKPAQAPSSERAPFDDDDEEDDLDTLMAQQESHAAPPQPARALAHRGPFTADDDDDPDDLDALMAEQEATASLGTTSPPRQKTGPAESDADEDDLDALMAEQEPGATARSTGVRPDPSKQMLHHLDDVVDEEEPLTGMVDE